MTDHEIREWMPPCTYDLGKRLDAMERRLAILQARLDALAKPTPHAWLLCRPDPLAKAPAAYYPSEESQ